MLGAFTYIGACGPNNLDRNDELAYYKTISAESLVADNDIRRLDQAPAEIAQTVAIPNDCTDPSKPNINCSVTTEAYANPTAPYAAGGLPYAAGAYSSTFGFDHHPGIAGPLSPLSVAPWFGGSYPFIVDDIFLVDDDDHHKRRRRHRRYHDDDDDIVEEDDEPIDEI